MRPIMRITLATAALALLHSGLASRPAKAAAARFMGERNRNAFYRPFYLAQSVLSFAGLVFYLKRLPNRVIWRAPAAAALAMNSLRLAALAAMALAVNQIGFRRLVGVTGLKDWGADRRAVAAEPEAQGPALDPDHPVAGPFRFSRHPLNFLGLPLVWLTPKLTRNRLVFNLLTSVYFVLGSWHEERRLRLAYPGKYQNYQKQTSFLFGWKRQPKSSPMAAV